MKSHKKFQKENKKMCICISKSKQTFTQDQTKKEV